EPSCDARCGLVGPGRGVGVRSRHVERARGLATLLALLARDAQGRAREGHDPGLADRLAARLARAEGARLEPLEGVGGLLEHVARVVHERELLLALEGRGTRVGLVVARAVARVAQQLGEL